MKKYVIIWYNLKSHKDDIIYVTAENEDEPKNIAIFIMNQTTKLIYSKKDIEYLFEISDEKCHTMESAIEKYGKIEEKKKDPIINTDCELNKNYVNSKIKAHILGDEVMKKLGFSDKEDHWYFCRMLSFPKKKIYKGFEVSFSVSIPKNGDDIKIDVIDEGYGQPYDYQNILIDDPTFETALIVMDEVEKWMDYLQNNEVLSGHIKGEYI